MTNSLTISMMTRQMLKFLGMNGIKAEEECEDLTGKRTEGDGIKQIHVDFLLQDKDLALSFDDFSERFLWPAANSMAVHIPSKVKKTVALPFPKGETCARHLYDNLSVRGILHNRPFVFDDGTEMPGVLARFDVAFRECELA